MTSASRKLLLGTVGEEEFARQVKRWAKRYGWHGIHVRYSQGVVEGVHTLRQDGHSDAHGAFDWEFVHSDRGRPLLKVELKSTQGRLSAAQQREYDLLRGCSSVEAYVWRPEDEDAIVRVLRGDQ